MVVTMESSKVSYDGPDRSAERGYTNDATCRRLRTVTTGQTNREDGRGVSLDGSALTIAKIERVARQGAPVALEPAAKERLALSHGVVLEALACERVVYGVNTGFGSLSRVQIRDEELQKLQRNLVRSHAAGVGDPLPEEVVRGMMLMLAASLSRGLSGVRPEPVSYTHLTLPTIYPG